MIRLAKIRKILTLATKCDEAMERLLLLGIEVEDSFVPFYNCIR